MGQRAKRLAGHGGASASWARATWQAREVPPWRELDKLAASGFDTVQMFRVQGFNDVEK